MSSFNKFYSTSNYLMDGTVNAGSDTFNVMLTNTAPVATNTTYGSISGNELANGSGYTTGGATLTTVSSGQSSGLYTLIVSAANPTWTASGSGMGPFRYVVMYDYSASTKVLIGWWDYGSSLTLSSGATFFVSFDQTNGVVQLQ